MGFSRQEYWSGWPFPPPGDLPEPGIEPTSPVSPILAGGFCELSLVIVLVSLLLPFIASGWQLLPSRMLSGCLLPTEFFKSKNVFQEEFQTLYIYF